MSTHLATPAQIAEALETSEDAVLELRRTGGLPFVMVTRTRWGVPWVAFTAWLLEQAGRADLVPLAVQAPPGPTTPAAAAYLARLVLTDELAGPPARTEPGRAAG